MVSVQHRTKQNKTKLHWKAIMRPQQVSFIRQTGKQTQNFERRNLLLVLSTVKTIKKGNLTKVSEAGRGAIPVNVNYKKVCQL